MSGKTDPKLAIKPPAKPPARRQEATMAFPVNEPMQETGYFPNASPKLLEALKKELSQYTMKVNDAGVSSYENFVSRIKTAGKITLGRMNMYVAKTSSMRFLIYTCPPEELYELSPAMMGVELKKRMILSSPKGKALFVSALSKKDYSALISICSSLSTNGVKESLVPDANHSFPRMDELVRRLKKAREVETPLLVFDMGTFADGMKFNIVLEDENNLAFHELTVGDEERTYRLYVNSSPSLPANFECVATFRFNDETCRLYEEK